MGGFFRGWETDKECHGFDDSELNMSYLKAEESRQNYEEECEVIEPFMCISRALSDNPAPIYIYKVKRLS